jgi:hypothetical protein
MTASKKNVYIHLAIVGDKLAETMRLSIDGGNNA